MWPYSILDLFGHHSIGQNQQILNFSSRFSDGGKLVLIILSLLGFFTFDTVYVTAVMNYAAQSEMLVYLIGSVRGLVEQKKYENVEEAIKVAMNPLILI